MWHRAASQFAAISSSPKMRSWMYSMALSSSAVMVAAAFVVPNGDSPSTSASSTLQPYLAASRTPTTLCEATVTASSPGMTPEEVEEERRDWESIALNNIPKGYEIMSIPDWGPLDGHAVFGSLLDKNKIEHYTIFKRLPGTSTDTPVVIARVQLGKHVNGHPGIVHGGIISLLFDDTFGFGFVALGVAKAFTANLSINYRAPLPAGTVVEMKAYLDRQEGRKLFWKADMTSLDGTVLYAQGTSLYIIPRSHA
eukprot:Nitzschia sp. Nitz4//scaffold19_size178191//13705//14463//NITZ4_001955-RA/size178191-processed-gene-0.44-mRNA-1//-1//CDS//3329540613//6117//frame0